MIKKLIAHFSKKHKSLFLVDSIGAFVTATLLFVVALDNNSYFGIPEKELTYLSALAAIFCTYSALCFIFLKGSTKIFFRLIGWSNLFYCVFTIGIMIKHHTSLRVFGIGYFLIEILVICLLSYVELNVE
jgi:hypothetical protein